MRYLLVIIIVFSFFSCSKNSNSNVINNDFTNEKTDKKIEVDDLKKQNNYGHLNNNLHNKIGIYLAQYYIEILMQTKMHNVSANRYYDLPNSKGLIALIIFDNEIMEIFNFHDGGGGSILGYKNDELIINNPYGSEKIIQIMNDYSVKNEYGMVFNCISTNIDDWRSKIRAYITNIIFGDKIYINNNEDRIFRIENGNIIKNNIEYEIHIDTVFSNKEYDLLHSQQWDKIYFKMYDNFLEIYQQKIPDEYIGEPMQDKFAEYKLIDIYK
jgi:hypothetical protein